MRFLKIAIVFTLLSLALGVGSGLSPRVAALGWVLGTLISLCAGAAFGLRAPSRGSAVWGGALAGGAPILIGCGVGVLVGPVPVSGLLAGVVVGLVAGGLAGIVARTIFFRPMSIPSPAARRAS
jgi:hypothetical protein